ncbi:MAG TPA: NAD(P)/FAD-dependent oxidoreductase, partial [Vicinamibacteria bacterium]|nr:NAD(P)/FAD-dependent oxidoreductase [Vicinamibacteria bacterium]
MGSDIRGRCSRERYDAVVVGAGPNGLAAAVTLAGAGASVLLLEGEATVGGGARTAELTLPGFRHDVCSAIHPLGVGSPFFRGLALGEHGLEWIQPPAALAHPLDDGRALVVRQSLETTADGLGTDGAAWRELFEGPARDWGRLSADLLAPLLRFPRHPLAMLRFALPASRSAVGLARARFSSAGVRALFAGLAAHSILPLERAFTASFGLVLGTTAHAVGWPVARGGSQAIADALASLLRARGGEVLTGARVASLDDLPPARAVLLDLTPRQLLAVAGSRLGGAYRRRLERFRYGPGVFKLDVALDGPVPWAAPECAEAGTVHLGATLEEIAAGEAAVWRGEHPARPFVLIAQQSLFDATRAPAGKHTLWAYCHVPHGSREDMTEPILAQIERFASGVRARVLAVHRRGPAAFEAYNPNYVGGDISGGAQDFDQLFGRPAWRRTPYATPVPGLYICSSSTPPGGGVHGMCGYLAARA